MTIRYLEEINHKNKYYNREKKIVTMLEPELMDVSSKGFDKIIIVSDKLIDMAIKYVNNHCSSDKQKIEYILWLKDKHNKAIIDDALIKYIIGLYTTLDTNVFTLNTSNIIEFLVYVDKRENKKQ
jgi:hypothetical protein